MKALLIMEKAILALPLLKTDPIGCYMAHSRAELELIEHSINQETELYSLNYREGQLVARLMLGVSGPDSPLKENGIKTTVKNVEAHISSKPEVAELRQAIAVLTREIDVNKEVLKYIREAFGFIKYYMVRTELIREADTITETELRLLSTSIREDLLRAK